MSFYVIEKLEHLSPTLIFNCRYYIYFEVILERHPYNCNCDNKFHFELFHISLSILSLHVFGKYYESQSYKSLKSNIIKIIYGFLMTLITKCPFGSKLKDTIENMYYTVRCWNIPLNDGCKWVVSRNLHSCKGICRHVSPNFNKSLPIIIYSH